MSIQPDVMLALEAQNPWWVAEKSFKLINLDRRRDLFQLLSGRLADLHRPRAIVLLGPRQVGKTVLIEQLIDEAVRERGWPAGNVLRFDFSDDRVRARNIQVDPNDLASFEPPGFLPSHPRLLMLDEIHWLPAWHHWLKRAVDIDSRRSTSMLRVLATDSAASMLRQGGIESGQGRWDDVRIWGLSFKEYLTLLAREGETPELLLQQEPRHLDDYLAKGGSPATIRQPPSEQVMRDIRDDIVGKAIRRDLLASNPVAPEKIDIDRVTRLFEVLVQDSSAILGLTKVSEAIGANRETVSHWISLLEDACLLHRVGPHLPASAVPGQKRRLSSKPKIHAADHGYIPALTLAPYPDAMQKVKDRVREAVVLRHLLDLVPDRTQIRYYGDNLGELDFVVPIAGELHAVEVTSERAADREGLRKIVRCAEAARAERITMVYDGMIDAVVEGVRLLPLRSFLLDPSTLVKGSQ